VPEEFTIDWPTSFAIVGSVVTIVLGWFGYISKGAAKAPVEPAPVLVDPLDQLAKRVYLIQAQFDSHKDSLAGLQGDIRELRVMVDNIVAQVTEHERRDIEDFRAINAKIDKLQDVMIRMLQDDKL
jgi:hypothetical protein